MSCIALMLLGQSVLKSTLQYFTIISLLTALGSAACCLYKKWAALVGVLAALSGGTLYVADGNETAIWFGLCGFWTLICLLIPAVGHALRRDSLYTEGVNDTTVE
jgi:hypothetical protein